MFGSCTDTSGAVVCPSFKDCTPECNSITAYKVMLAVGIVMTYLAFIGILSNAIGDPSFSGIKAITLNAGSFFGTDGMTFSVFIFSLSAATGVGGGIGWYVMSQRPESEGKRSQAKGGGQPAPSAPAPAKFPPKKSPDDLAKESADELAKENALLRQANLGLRQKMSAMSTAGQRLTQTVHNLSNTLANVTSGNAATGVANAPFTQSDLAASFAFGDGASDGTASAVPPNATPPLPSSTLPLGTALLSPLSPFAIAYPPNTPPPLLSSTLPPATVFPPIAYPPNTPPPTL